MFTDSDRRSEARYRAYQYGASHKSPSSEMIQPSGALRKSPPPLQRDCLAGLPIFMLCRLLQGAAKGRFIEIPVSLVQPRRSQFSTVFRRMMNRASTLSSTPLPTIGRRRSSAQGLDAPREQDPSPQLWPRLFNSPLFVRCVGFKLGGRTLSTITIGILALRQLEPG